MLSSKGKLLLLMLAFLHQSYCDDLYLYDSDDECEDDLFVASKNGTSEYHSFLRTAVKFYLLNYTNETTELNSTNLHLVNTSQPTKFLIHGLGAYQDHVWIDQIATKYHTNGNYNIIAVDWSEISTKDSLYIVSAVDSVGNVVADFIMDLTQLNVEYLSSIHLIGASVGAQVGGAAGKSVAKSGNKVDRITGLDPTEPEDLQILNATDANFVDVIHTSVEFADKQTGTVDFYVTSDEPYRPVCYNNSCGDLLLADDFYIMTIDDPIRFEGVSCYNSSAYVGKLCDKANAAVMGEHVSRNASGSYWVAKAAASGVHAQGKFLLSCTVALVLRYLCV